MSRGRELLLRLLLVAFSFAAAGAVAEIALRLVGYAAERYPASARLHDPQWKALLDCYPTNPRGYFDLDLRRPETREQYRWIAPNRYDVVAPHAPYAVLFRYNALRFRDRPLEARPPGVQRVVVIGDSFTEGQGVKEPDTYARVLETRLTASGGAYEVRNCGRRGLDFPEMVDAFSDAIPFGADVVVYGMVLNDGARSPEFQARQAYVNDWIMARGQMESRAEVLRPFWTRSRVLSLAADRWEARHIDAASTTWYRQMYGAENADGWRRTQALIRQMDERTRAQGGRFLVALWPLLVDLGPRYPFAETHETIRQFCASAGIPFLDLRGALAGPPMASLWVHPIDRHPNEVAHRLAAEALAPVVRGMLTGESTR
jgi:lysophospholipase L1-like esterase